jgi:hypothetical protein
MLPGSGQALAHTLRRPPSARLPAGGGHPIEHLHRHFGRLNSEGTATSQNWAGYDATGGGFASVTASWVEPPIQASYSAETYAFFWVGLDGDGSSTVEQTGTAAYSQDGSVSYYAWYEMYPDPSIPIYGMTVSPGDEMAGTVTSDSPGDFTLTLLDDTTHDSFTTTQTNGVTAPFSAEVIAEAPTSIASGTIFPLADFGSVSFTNCAFNGQPLSAFAYNQIDMVSAGGLTEAAASALGTDGASFSVTSYPASDTTSPVTIASGYDSAWHNSAVQVTLTATDNDDGSGVRSITYNIDGGVPTTVDADTAQVTIGAAADHSNDGVHTLSFYSTDNDGNQETAKSAIVKIDTTPPTLSASGASDGAWLNHAATITLTAADTSGGSGVASISYSIDGVAHTAAGASTQVVIPASPNATHTLTYHATDLAGNVSADRQLSVHIDTLSPTTTVTGADDLWHNHSVKLILHAADNAGGSGVAYTEYSLNGGKTWTKAASVTIAASADHANDGSHTVEYGSADKAGNLEKAKSVTVKIDTTGPVTAAEAASGTAGHALNLRYLVRDTLSPSLTDVRLVVKNAKDEVVKSFTCGTRRVANWYAVAWKPTAKGTYRYFVYGTDLAGNKQAKVGSAKITVK